MYIYFTSKVKSILLTFSMKKEERKTPDVAIIPPKNAVFRNPNRSTSTPEIGDNTNVEPTNSDPTKDAFVSELLSSSRSYIFFKAT